MRLKTLSIFLVFNCFILNGQNVNLKLDSIEFNFPKNKINKETCFIDNSKFKLFKEIKGLNLFLPINTKVEKLVINKNGSIIYDLDLEEIPIIITVSEYPEDKISLKDLILIEYFKNKSSNNSYNFGSEEVNNKIFYWKKDLKPDKDLNIYNTLFYYYNSVKNKIFLIHFTTLESSNCKINSFIIGILKEL